MPHRQAHFTQDGERTQELSNLVYVRAFDGCQGHYYAYVTCISAEEEMRRFEMEEKERPRLQKIVPKDGPHTGPKPGFYKADQPSYTDCPIPSFFYIDEEEGNRIHPVEYIQYLCYKDLEQYAKDTEVHTANLDLVEAPLKEGSALALYRVNNTLDGIDVPRKWSFSPRDDPETWPHTTLFHDVFLESD